MIVSAKFLLLLGTVAISCSSLIETTAEEEKNEVSMRDKLKRTLSRAVSGKYFEREYSKISDYLIDHSEPEDPDSNMRIAKNWLNSDKEISIPLSNALEQFTELSKVDSVNRCSEKAYNILSMNDRAVSGRAREIRVGKDPKFERVDKVIRQYCMGHAKKCMKVYPENYSILITKLRKIDIRRVKKFTDAIINFRLAESKRQGEAMKIYGDIVSPTRQVTLRGANAVDAAYDAIKELSVVDDLKESKRYSIRKRIRTQFEKYIRAPCKIYNEILGKDLFIPASFDSIYFHKVDDNAIEFYKGWARFKICKELLGDQGSSLLKDVIEVANQR